MNARTLFCVVVATICLVAALWKWTPLGDFIEPSRLAEWLEALRNNPFAPLIIVGIYLCGSALMLPNSALNAATILSLGSGLGLAYALGGSMTAALTFYALGNRFGAGLLRRVEREKRHRLQRAMSHVGVVKVTAIRLVPLAPFSVVNLVAGSVRVGVFPFAIGTFLALLPGNLMMTIFGHQLRALISEPGLRNAMVLIAILIFAGLLGWWLRRRIMVDL